jgi:hypothetical protein
MPDVPRGLPASGQVPLTPLCRATVTNSTLSFAKPPAGDAFPGHLMPTAKARASAILAEFEHAQTELVGKTVVLADGKAGTVDGVWLDELHGLRISITGHDGKWPVSTIKFAQS